ncbi:IS30 family transposase [Alcanivorax sp.]|uniref:IS30 family transposase n=1 Tax=Alcanivorax sp. TaxID=1872427 RepID=UPI0025B9D3B7|nr:IS30 family transposase [Alcanivorax sp.]|tara:strand:- start:206 stop:1171 length:966 start_codon:yes stop_codon:yes gene_type:complete
MSYHHVTKEERYQIYSLLRAGWLQKDIAEEIGRHPSTLSRELNRNRGQKGYRPKQADGFAAARQAHSADNAECISTQDWQEIESHLREDWSPEQIAGRTGLASHESIYVHVYRDREAGGDLHRHLRCQKKRRKRYGSGRDRRGMIPNRTPISERPAIVDERRRLGDWEGDLVIGNGHSGAIVTLAERRTQAVIIRKVDSKAADGVSRAMTEMLGKLKRVSHTLTLDNGKEFSQHEKVASKIGIDTYFADSYSSWQRGLNEQINGLIRQYLPKARRFDDVTESELAMIEKKLNHRPRKRLGFSTPAEEFQALAKKQGIALRL